MKKYFLKQNTGSKILSFKGYNIPNDKLIEVPEEVVQKIPKNELQNYTICISNKVDKKAKVKVVPVKKTEKKETSKKNEKTKVKKVNKDDGKTESKIKKRISQGFFGNSKR